MSSYQKMVLVPFPKDPDVEKQKSELDQKMEEIIKRRDLTDYEKMKLYQQTLGIYLRLNSNFQPSKFINEEPKSSEETQATTSQPTSNPTMMTPEKIKEDILKSQKTSPTIDTPSLFKPEKSIKKDILELFNNKSQLTTPEKSMKKDIMQILGLKTSPQSAYKSLFGNETINKNDTLLNESILDESELENYANEPQPMTERDFKQYLALHPSLPTPEKSMMNETINNPNTTLSKSAKINHKKTPKSLLQSAVFNNFKSKETPSAIKKIENKSILSTSKTPVIQKEFGKTSKQNSPQINVNSDSVTQRKQRWSTLK